MQASSLNEFLQPAPSHFWVEAAGGAIHFGAMASLVEAADDFAAFVSLDFVFHKFSNQGLYPHFLLCPWAIMHFVQSFWQ